MVDDEFDDYMSTREEYWKLFEAALNKLEDPIKTDDLSKTGDSDRFIMTMEKTLVCRNEKAIGVVADLQ